MTDPDLDVLVIGAGVVGCAIARELSHLDLRCAILEAGTDIGTGTSKANTAIRHTGFDAKPGSLEATLLRRGYPLMQQLVDQAGIPLEKTGALLVAWTDEQRSRLPDIEKNAHRNGCTDVTTVTAEAVYQAEPHLGPGAQGGLLVPGEGIICPFTAPLALATDAVTNGADLRLGHRVTGVHPVPTSDGSCHAVDTTGGTVTTRWVINAAGLASDEIDHLFGHHDFTITPRRGQLIVFDKVTRPLLSHVILPVPSAKTKGVLVSPTVFGNILLGPTAEDLPDKTATETTREGLTQLMDKGAPILPELMHEEITATYSGLRAATEHSDYQIRAHPDQRYLCVGGIRSTGLSASLGIAEYVLELLRDAGMNHKSKMRLAPPVRMPMIGEAFTRPYQDPDAIAADPACGQILCHCERTTRAEIIAAAHAPVPARDLGGLRRRTRAMMGRCQGFYCTATVTAAFAEATGQSVDHLLAQEDRP